MSGPVASNLVLLSDLKKCSAGTKVRFLGCVDEYIVKAATLRLKHAYPTADRPVVASVNIDHVLERVKHHELDVGTWLNVIGHVLRKEGSNVSVQAVAIWDAGNVDVQAYEKAMEIRKEAG